MDKLVTLCWRCQELFKDVYKVTVMKNAKPDKKCANCNASSGEFATDLCRVQSK